MNSLHIEIPLQAEKAETVIDSVGFEAQQEEYERSQVQISYTNGNLVLDLTAKDLTSLRAALNTHLRWVETSIKLLDE